jgi:hypothetical protein
VQEIVDLVDEDGSNQIEFGEFLSIIKGGSNAVSNHTHSLIFLLTRVWVEIGRDERGSWQL